MAPVKTGPDAPPDFVLGLVRSVAVAVVEADDDTLGAWINGFVKAALPLVHVAGAGVLKTVRAAVANGPKGKA